MPRRSRKPPPGRDEALTGGAGWQIRRATSDGDFLVRPVPGAASTKPYRCPGCSQTIAPGTAHVVVWPEWTPAGNDGVERRRHWHRSCWERRASRGGPGALF